MSHVTHPHGLLADIYRTKHGDCTNGGVSSRVDEVVLIGPMVSGPFAPDAQTPALVVVPWYGGFKAVPVDCPKGQCGPMFGGNFVFTSDSRMPGNAPIPIHDRFETGEHHATFD